jgi:hypothetical protein
MWVIRDDHLFSLPDNSPLPPNAKRVDLPEDFLGNPRGYKIEGGAFVKREAKDVKTSAQTASLMLTVDEINRVRAAIAKGVI